MFKLNLNPSLLVTSVGRRIFCFLFGCRIEKRKCTRCFSEFGVPKMENHPKHPIRCLLIGHKGMNKCKYCDFTFTLPEYPDPPKIPIKTD